MFGFVIFAEKLKVDFDKMIDNFIEDLGFFGILKCFIESIVLNWKC